MTILTFTAGLAHVLGFLGDSLGDGFLVGDLRCADIRLHLELPQQAVNDDFQMKLAHAGDDRLTSFFIRVGFECGVLFRKLRKRKTHLLLPCLRLRLNCHTNDRLGELQRLQDDGMCGVTQGVAGGGVLETDCCGDVAGVHAVQIFSVVCVHQQNASHALTLVLVGIDDGLAGLQRTGVDAEEREFTNIRIGHNFEGEGGERRVVGRLAGLFFLGLRVHAGNGFLVQR